MKRGFLKGTLLGVMIGIAGTLILGYAVGGSFRVKAAETQAEADAVVDDDLLGATSADFKTAVMGEASEHQELIVMEQPLSVPTTITRSGLANLPIFSKMKTITYFGTGVYTINMAELTEGDISVDENKKQVTVNIPHAQLQYVNYDMDKTEFEDTEKGILSFGDITLTQEEQQDLEKSVNSAMKAQLSEDEYMEQADEYGTMKVWQLLQPVVTAVSPEYTIDIETK